MKRCYYILSLLFILSLSFVLADDGIAILPVQENATASEPTLPEAPAQDVSVPQPSILQTLLTLITDKIEVLRGELLQIKAILLNEENIPIADQEILFYADAQEIGREYTNQEGEAMMFWDTAPFSPGAYQIQAKYNGDTGYAGKSVASEVVVQDSSPLTAYAVAAEPPAVQEVESCYDSTSYEQQTIMDTCTKEVVKKICSDEPVNQSCNDETRIVDYECNPHTETVQKSERVCQMTALIVNNAVRISNIGDYACSTQEGAEVIVLCDSRFDGNGDGKCTSGESCMRFTIDGNTVTKEEKNSRNDFVAEDDKYFLDEATTEVIG
ncbi:MAG: Ig-like domain-containing protein [Nanoarchaeota archaeon]|nr:Ig-like domain-containing protein [Nanoarchaeota archaeon]